MEGDDVLVDCDGEKFFLPIGSIKRANVKGMVDFG
jgi:hypothetical protein